MKRIKNYAISLLLLLSHSAFANYEVNRITYLNVDASINPAIFNFLEDNLKKLSKENGDLAFIKLDTPGGLVSTTKDILTLIGSLDYPVGVWITPEGASATSAGAIISSAAHFLVMSEGTNIGAATPITMGKDIDQKDGRAKAVNDIVALVRSLSKARGRNPDFFEKMISEAISLDARDALEKNVIDKIVNRQSDLIDFLATSSVTIKGEEMKLIVAKNVMTRTVEMDPGQQILNIFSNPTTAYILFIIGAALLYFELQAPGGFIAGALGACCLVLAGIGFQVLPLNFGAVGLIVLSFVLFILEVYITSFGILTIGGIITLILGSLFLFRTDNSLIELEISVIISVVASITAYVSFLGWYIFKTWHKHKDFYGHAHDEGVVLQVLDRDKKKYQVRIEGEIWTAKSEEYLELHDAVEVISQDDEHLTMTIKKI